MSPEPASARGDAGRGTGGGSVALLASVGCAHAVLFLIAYALLASTPGARASDAELVAFYESDGRQRLVVAGLYVMPFAGITFVWFSVALRAFLGSRWGKGGELFSAVQFVSGVLYVALFLAAAAADSVVAISVELSEASVDPMIARQLPQYGSTLMLGFAMRMAAMFVFTTSRLARIAGRIPAWFAHCGWAVGLFLLLSASLRRELVLVFPLWLLALCGMLLARSRSQSVATVPGS